MLPYRYASSDDLSERQRLRETSFLNFGRTARTGSTDIRTTDRSSIENWSDTGSRSDASPGARRLLEIIPARGTFVRSISNDQLRELYEVRQALEGQAAELAAKNGATERLLDFVGKLEGSRKARTDKELGKTYEIGAQFHVEVFKCAGNSILTELYLPIRNRFRATMSLGRYYDRDWVIDGIDQHLIILDAVCARKPAKAKQLMRVHLQASFESKQKTLKQITRELQIEPRMTS